MSEYISQDMLNRQIQNDEFFDIYVFLEIVFLTSVNEWDLK